MGTMHDKMKGLEEVDCRQCIHLHEYYAMLPICGKLLADDKSDEFWSRLRRDRLHEGDCPKYESHRGQHLLYLAGIAEEE